MQCQDGLVFSYSLECNSAMYLDRTDMGNHANRPSWFELHNLHRSLDGPTASGVDSFDACFDSAWPTLYLLVLHVRIPARMVANVLESVEAEHLSHRAIYHLLYLNFHRHGFLLYR